MSMLTSSALYLDLLCGRFSSSDAGSHAYGITDEFLVLNASVHLVVHSDGAVFMVIVNLDDDSGDHLVFDFGSFWISDNALTLRAGRDGLVLTLANASDMESFERACDQVLPFHVAGSMQPTLEQLGELGIITVPRLIGGFLRGDPVVQDPLESCVEAPQGVEPVNDGEDEPSVYEDATDAVTDGGGHGAHPALLDDAVDEIDFNFKELEALVEEAVDELGAQMDDIEEFTDLAALVEEAVHVVMECLSS
ncbi:hypothetical protein OH76DRAFT_1487972 [Lentinus brumalis]|uniref:Uncharacterized protein n=1 Tax=Lentinus brumalis TaxID=2498619 RepID=A0A371CSL2_9APHY|nr:hypothetical protein OH76DRAFT_1487972 [Polyporus brumalis]